MVRMHAAAPTYALYLESGPKRRKTMVHVPELLGCVAVGATTDEAVAATPAAVRAYLAFLQRHGEMVDPAAPFDTRIAEHVTEGEWLGNGSPYLAFAFDLEPVPPEEIDVLLRRFRWLREDLAAWAAAQDDAALDAAPVPAGRPARAVLLHMMGGPGNYLSAPLGGLKGFSATVSAAERGEVGLAEGLLRIAAMACDAVHAATPAQRSAVIERPGRVITLRKALRRTLEHDWEHFAELVRRPGGPEG